MPDVLAIPVYHQKEPAATDRPLAVHVVRTAALERLLDSRLADLCRGLMIGGPTIGALDDSSSGSLRASDPPSAALRETGEHWCAGYVWLTPSWLADLPESECLSIQAGEPLPSADRLLAVLQPREEGNREREERVRRLLAESEERVCVEFAAWAESRLARLLGHGTDRSRADDHEEARAILATAERLAERLRAAGAKTATQIKAAALASVAADRAEAERMAKGAALAAATVESKWPNVAIAKKCLRLAADLADPGAATEIARARARARAHLLIERPLPERFPQADIRAKCAARAILVDLDTQIDRDADAEAALLSEAAMRGAAIEEADNAALADRAAALAVGRTPIPRFAAHEAARRSSIRQWPPMAAADTDGSGDRA